METGWRGLKRSLMIGAATATSLLCLDLTGAFAFIPSRSASSTSIGISHRQLESADAPGLYFFFGNNNDGDGDRENKQLGFFPKLATKNTDVKFDSLTTFIATWAKKFEDDRKGMGLTTPVKVFALPKGDFGEDIEEQDGVRIIFQPTKTAYKSKEEENAKGEGNDKKKDSPKEGRREIAEAKAEKLSL